MPEALTPSKRARYQTPTSALNVRNIPDLWALGPLSDTLSVGTLKTTPQRSLNLAIPQCTSPTYAKTSPEELAEPYEPLFTFKNLHLYIPSQNPRPGTPKPQINP